MNTSFHLHFARQAIQKNSDPVDDLDKRAPGKYSAAEAEQRRKTAAMFRLIDLFGWTEGIYGHVWTCIGEEVLVHPLGMLFHEVTASSLLRLDPQGNILDYGSTNLTYNNRSMTLYSTIRSARPDVGCAVHLHTPEVMAFSSLKRKLLPIHQEASYLGEVTYLDYYGPMTPDVLQTVADNMSKSNVMILKNHGFVICGKSVEEVFHRTYLFLYAVNAQLRMCSVPLSEWEPCNNEADKFVKANSEFVRGEYSGIDSETGKKQFWPQGHLNWEAWMRMLDRLGHKTGHKYRQPLYRDTEEAVSDMQEQ